MSEYPEHIDQIDDFYRSQLADHEIEPPAGLWDKISASAFETSNPEAHTTVGSGSSSVSSFLTTTQKLIIGLGTATVLIVGGTFYWNTHKTEHTNTEKENPPAIEQPVDGSQDSSNPTETNTNDKQEVIPTPSSEGKNSTQSTGTSEVEPTLNPEVSEQPVNQLPTEHTVVAEPEKTKADSIADIQTTQKAAPKEKVKFKDKYKKDYQDSTHKIFVPGK